MTLLKMTDILLNSEQLTILDNKNIAHKISNIYPTDQTEYYYGPIKDLIVNGVLYEGHRITIPLIHMDLEHPEKTLERLKTLLVFL